MQQLLLSSKACVRCWTWQVFMFSFSFGSAEQGFYWELQDSSRNYWIPSFSHHVFHLKVKNAKHLFLTKALIWSEVCGCLLLFLHSLLGKFNIKFLWGKSSGCCPCSRNHCFSVRLACMSAAISLIEHEARWVMISVAFDKQHLFECRAAQPQPHKNTAFSYRCGCFGTTVMHCDDIYMQESKTNLNSFVKKMQYNIWFFKTLPFFLLWQAGSTVCCEPTSVGVRDGKLWCQRHHGGTTEPGVGCGVVGQTQVSESHWSLWNEKVILCRGPASVLIMLVLNLKFTFSFTLCLQAVCSTFLLYLISQSLFLSHTYTAGC